MRYNILNNITQQERTYERSYLRCRRKGKLDIKSSLITKAIKVAQKRDWDKVYSAFDDLETLVTTVGADK